MKNAQPVEGLIQRLETRDGRTRLYELYYKGWLDQTGKLQLTACGGKSRPVSQKTESLMRALRRVA